MLDKYNMPVPLQHALRTMAAHVREANDTLKMHATEALSFISLMGDPSHLERTVNELKREIRRAYNVLRRHQGIQQVQEAVQKFERWVKLLVKVGKQLSAAHPAPAIQWLHAALLNYSDQRQALHRLKIRTVKMVWKAQVTKQNNATFIKELCEAVGVLSHGCKGLRSVIGSQWQPARQALTNLSMPAMSLSLIKGDSKQARELALELSSSVLNPMNRQLRKLYREVGEDTYHFLVSNIGKSWQTALVQSAHVGFLLNLTTSQLTDLKHRMNHLENLVVLLTSQTTKLENVIVNMLGYLWIGASNNPPPILNDIKQLALHLKFFENPPLISDGRDYVNGQLKRLRQEIKKVLSS
jgi:hypothetical protein